MANTHFVILDENVPKGAKNQMLRELKKIDGINNVIALGEYVGSGIPDFILPDSVKAIGGQDGYEMMMLALAIEHNGSTKRPYSDCRQRFCGDEGNINCGDIYSYRNLLQIRFNSRYPCSYD